VSPESEVASSHSPGHRLLLFSGTTSRANGPKIEAPPSEVKQPMKLDRISALFERSPENEDNLSVQIAFYAIERILASHAFRPVWKVLLKWHWTRGVRVPCPIAATPLSWRRACLDPQGAPDPRL